MYDFAAEIPALIGAAMPPVFMLAGLGGFLNVISTRLIRSVDRWRMLDEWIHGLDGDPPAVALRELHFTERRIALANIATSLCVASGLSICVVVVMIFINPVFRIDLARWAGLFFIAGIVLLAAGLIAFLLEVRAAIRAPRTRLTPK